MKKFFGVDVLVSFQCNLLNLIGAQTLFGAVFCGYSANTPFSDYMCILFITNNLANLKIDQLRLKILKNKSKLEFAC